MPSALAAPNGLLPALRTPLIPPAAATALHGISVARRRYRSKTLGDGICRGAMPVVVVPLIEPLPLLSPASTLALTVPSPVNRPSVDSGPPLAVRVTVDARTVNEPVACAAFFITSNPGPAGSSSTL